MTKIVPAILTNSPAELETLLRQAESFTPWAQIDIMDGQFVPSQSITSADIIQAKPKLQWEAHLMVRDPADYFGGFKEAGVQRVVFHYEATSYGEQTIAQARAMGLQVGLAVNPETPVSALQHLLNRVDSVLFLSVNPGFYGAPFIPEVLDKIRELRRLSPQANIGIDGGIKESNVNLVAQSGVDSICVGSAIFREPDPGKAFRQLQSLADQTAQLSS
ncbi:ribulose-phosphate 3-epimerase [Chloroflexota bacterium]